MKTLLMGLVGLTVVAENAAAQARYDLKLEEAVKTVIAGKIGDLRPGFAFGHKPRIDLMPDDIASLAAPKTQSWSIVDGGGGMAASSSGSFQAFSDGSPVTEAQRKSWSTKTVSRVINF